MDTFVDVEERLAATRRVMLPPPTLTISEWADRERVLSPESSAEPGRWRTERAAYQRGIMDAICDVAIEQVVVMSSAQVGKTEIINNTAGYYVSQDPSPMLVVQPTLEMGEAWSKDRLAPMVRDTPCLTGRVAEPNSRGSGNTLLHKTFPGGHITIAGANSPASLASRPVRILLLDEVDRYPPSAGTEGDPVSLAIKRTRTFHNRRVVLTSTPTIAGASRIEQAFAQSDQRRYHVPCPHCAAFQVLAWANVKPQDDPEAARIACVECGALLDDADRVAMIATGEWRPTAPFRGVAGFHLWEIYSPWVSLADIVDDYVKAKPYPETLKAWVNTCRGEPWEDRTGEKIASDSLAGRAGGYRAGTVPEAALLVTAGVDVQRDRLEVATWAYGPGEEAFVVDYALIEGNPASAAPWAELDLYLARPLIHESGATLRTRAACVDAGDGLTMNAVLDYCRRRMRPARLGDGLIRPPCLAIKGQSQASKPPIGRPTKVEFTWRGESAPRAALLWPVGSDAIKGWLMGRIAAEGMVHFPEGLPDDFYAQLTSERLVTKYTKGMPKREWVKTSSARNEALDASCYAYAAAVWAGLKRAPWDFWRGKLAQPTPEPPNATTAPKRPLESKIVPRPRRGFVTGWRT